MSDMDHDLDLEDGGEDEDYDCAAFFDKQGPGGVLVCGRVGSEECDWECPYSDSIGEAWEDVDADDDEE